MLRLPKFKYLQPKNLADALDMMSDAGPDAMYVAGGTDLYPNMKRRQHTPKIVIGLGHLKDLRFLEGGPKEGIRLGAGLTLSEVTEDPGVSQRPSCCCPGRGTGFHSHSAEHGYHRWKPSPRYALQLHQSELRVAKGS